ncbi:MAG: hypothetical protein HZA95_03770 [Candidatus Vogelbacteria bacterium]|nr:hypothetical protein [Candidatus Vogelbacteria bacterium]
MINEPNTSGSEKPKEVTAEEVIQKLKTLGAENQEARELLGTWIDQLHAGENERIKEKAASQAAMEIANLRRATEAELGRPLDSSEETGLRDFELKRRGEIETLISHKEALLVDLKMADLYVKAGFGEAARELLSDSGKQCPGDPEDNEIGARLMAREIGDKILVDAVEDLLNKIEIA